MTLCLDIGYMNDDYLSELNYMQGLRADCTGMQVSMVADDLSKTGMQVDMQNSIDIDIGMQVTMQVLDNLKRTGMQINAVTFVDNSISMQVDMQLSDTLVTGMEVKIAKLTIVNCGGYLSDNDYMDEPYLGPVFCALQGMQVEMQLVDRTKITGMQTQMQIVDDVTPQTGMQTNMQILDRLKSTGMQVDVVTIVETGMSVNMVLYNITQLRFLCDFTSRGLPGQNSSWTSIQTLEPGDFSADNLNTDVFEQRTQTNGLIPQWELRCDTGKFNSFVDTIAILEHNFTTGAVVVFQASDTFNFAVIKYQKTIVAELINMYYILPVAEAPPASARYYRLIITDSTNLDADGYKIGIVVFGTSTIFSLSETYQIPVRFGFQHFKDSIETEGFTNVSNDRSLRKILGLEFTDIDYNGGNFEKIRNYYLDAKTDVKCLIIPTPEIPSLFAVFAKLESLPEEEHTAIQVDPIETRVHVVAFNLNWDESL